MGDNSRLDISMVSQNIVSSRQRAKELIQSNIVYVNGKQAVKASMRVDETSRIEVRGQLLQYVSRGGIKLEYALSCFEVDVKGLIAADFGASTGGFTDCLLQNGAVQVYAIDVGTAQLHESLLSDARVCNIEKTDVRNVTSEMLGGGVDIIVCDLSFISVAHALPIFDSVLNCEGLAVVLVKPQFEAGRGAHSKKGVVRSSQIHKTVLHSFCHTVKQCGFRVVNLTASPITGGNGNIEYLALLLREGISANDTDISIEKIVASAHEGMR